MAQVGTFCGVVSTFNPELNEFRDTMDDLNRFMERETFPAELKVRLRAYFHQSKHLRLAGLQSKLIANMPPSLQVRAGTPTHHSPHPCRPRCRCQALLGRPPRPSAPTHSLTHSLTRPPTHSLTAGRSGVAHLGGLAARDPLLAGGFEPFHD